jgi:hypothetical protein
MLHVLLKGGSLLGGVRRIIEAKNNLNPFEPLRIQVIPVGCGLELKVISFRRVLKEFERLQRKVDVVALYVGGVKREDVQRRLLRPAGWASPGRNNARRLRGRRTRLIIDAPPTESSCERAL